MSKEIAVEIIGQSAEDLGPIVSRIVGERAEPRGGPTAKKIGRSAGHGTAGIFHVTGKARIRDSDTQWSAVVKALGTPENPSPGTEVDPFRELDVYRSRAFAQVCGGVRAPHSYGIQARNGVQLLWLEDLSDAPQPPWEPAHFVATARNLGQFNAFWPEEALPQWDWLSPNGFRANFTQNPRFMGAFERFPQQQTHPLMRRFVPPVAASRLMQLWEACDELLVQAETTSKGICHLDCHPKNLFPMQGTGSESYTVGIDWVKVGVANHGIDIGHLLASPMSWLEVTPEEAEQLRDPIFDAYLAGMAESGWIGNEDGVRLTYLTRLAGEAIRNTNLISHASEDPKWRNVMEQFLGLSIQEIAVRYAKARDFYIACKDEAVELAKRF